jgi:hypothetical protein
MTKYAISVFFIVLALVGLAGCDSKPDYAALGYEDGLHQGHADVKAQGYCDKPFPKEWPAGFHHTMEQLRAFEHGYYKGCAVARKSAPPPIVVPQHSARPLVSRPHMPRCEAR